MITPRMSMNFTTGVLDPSITFTRALNTATRVNSSGLIELVNADLPRFDYDHITLACKGLLLEESRANLVLHSQAFDNVYWLKSGTTIDDDAAVSPDGTANADALVENTATSAHSLYKSLGSLTGTYTQSCYVEAAGRTWCYMEPLGNSATRTFFNLSGAGSLGAVGTGVTARITAIGGGFYRIETTYTYAAQTGVFVLGAATANATPSYTGNGAEALYLWGAQVEAGASATSYIPTSTTSLTRNADVATITGTNFSDWWQAGKGGVLVRARPGTVSGVRPWLQFDDGTANEIIALRGNTTNPELYIVDGGTPQAQIDAGTISANTDYSLTGWWATNDCKARLDSGAVVTDTSATIPTVTQARLGSDGTNYLNGHLASISYYDSFSEQIYTRRKNKAVFNLM